MDGLRTESDASAFYNNAPELYQLPGKVAFHNQSQESSTGQNRTADQAPTNRHRLFPHCPHDSATAFYLQSGGCSALKFPSKYGPSLEEQNRMLVLKRLPNHISGISQNPVFQGNLLLTGDRLRQQTAEGTHAKQELQIERTPGVQLKACFTDIQKEALNSENLQQHVSERPIGNINYINSCLVQKVLECQKSQKRSKTPVIHLSDFRRQTQSPRIPHTYWKDPKVECSGTSYAGHSDTKPEKLDHYLSDLSLNNRVGDCRINDPDSVSTESQRDLGYHSGDSTGDQLSATSDCVDLGRATVPWTNAPPMLHLGPQSSGTPDEQCEYYFVRADNFMDLCSEQEQLGDMDQALNFLNKAIDYFQQAANVVGASSENILRMRMKENKAVLFRRKLTKQTNRTRRRLPCVPHEAEAGSSVDKGFQGFQRATDNYGQEPIDYKSTHGIVLWHCPKEPSYQECKTVALNGTKNLCVGNDCLQTDLQPYTTDKINDVNLYATLPKRNKNGHLDKEKASCNPIKCKILPEFQMLTSAQDLLHQSQRDSNQSSNLLTQQSSTGSKSQQMPVHCANNRMLQLKVPRSGNSTEMKLVTSNTAYPAQHKDDLQPAESRPLDQKTQGSSQVARRTTDEGLFRRF